MVNVKQKKGFTLIELLIAITIFMGFMIVVSNAFVSIMRAQKTANETRLIYSEMRNFVDLIDTQMREGGIDYFCYNNGFQGQVDFNAASLVRCEDVAALTVTSDNNLRTISRDGMSSSVIKFVNGKVCQVKYRNDNGAWKLEAGYETGDCGGNYKEIGFGDLKINDLRMEIYPKMDPKSVEAQKKGNLGSQIAPMVRMYLDVGSKNANVPFAMKFETALTARN